MKFGPPETQVIGRFSLDAPATALSALKREREREWRPPARGRGDSRRGEKSREERLGSGETLTRGVAREMDKCRRIAIGNPKRIIWGQSRRCSGFGF